MVPRNTQASTDSSQAIGGLTPAQSQKIFEIYRQTAENEQATAAREHEFKLECMQRESEARITAAVATATAAAAAPLAAPAPAAALRAIGGDDDILGEVPQEVQNLTLRFAGLPREEIVKIFHNRFKPINLYRLRHMRCHHYESYHDQERIGIEDGMLRLKKTSGTYKDFGKLFYEVWSETFINYSVSLFAPYRGA